MNLDDLWPTDICGSFTNDNDDEQQQQCQPKKQSTKESELPAAKAVTFSASTIRENSHHNNNNNKTTKMNSYDEGHEMDADDVMPPISPSYALHPTNTNTAPPRERSTTLESDLTDSSSLGESTSGISKKMLIKLMKEQVNLVRDLTNAQIQNKKELEKVRGEKERLEEEMRGAGTGVIGANAAGDVNGASANTATKSSVNNNNNNSNDQQQLKNLYNKSSHAKLNLPQTVQRDTSDSRSVSSKSFFDRFRSPSHLHGNRNHGYPYSTKFHPDEEYYRHRSRAFSGDTYGTGVGTVNNAGVSMASTILPTQIMVGQDGHPQQQQQQSHGYNPQQQQQAAIYNRDKIEITPIPERNVVPPSKRTCFDSFWFFFSRFVTFFLPDVFLCCIGRHAKYTKGMNSSQKASVKQAKSEAKQAWREKVGIFVIMLLCSSAFIGISGVIPVLLCRETSVFTMDEIQARDRSEDWTVIFGTIYDIQEYISSHPGGNSILDVVAKDSSKVFPRRPLGRLPDVCMNPNLEYSTEATCQDFDEVDKLVDLHCHTTIVGFSGIARAFGEYERGTLAHRPQNLENDVYTDWIVIYDRVYNVTSYIEGITDKTTGKLDGKSENAYLNEDLTKLIVNKRGEDATDVYEALYSDDVALSCLDDLFYVGVMDEPPDL